MGKLSCHAEGYQHQVHESTERLDLEWRQRQALLKSLELNRPGSNAEERFFERVRRWKELTHDFLLELYTLRRVINSVNQLYYEGQQALFPQVAQGLEELVGYIERLVDLYKPGVVSSSGSRPWAEGPRPPDSSTAGGGFSKIS